MSSTTITLDSPLDITLPAHNVGAEIHGLDLTKPLDLQTIAAIRQALLDRFVLFFPDQHLSPAEQIAFTRQFGELTRGTAIGPGLAGDGFPEVQILDSRTRKGSSETSTWHTDMTFLSTPPGAAVFQAVVVPPAGGDTAFASTAVAYDTLPKPLQELADELVAVHDWLRMNETLEKTGGGEWDGKPFTRIELSEHPVVRIHPESGRKSLYLSENRVTGLKGLAKHESDALLRLFYAHITKPEHVVRRHWEPGTIAFWDNRTVMHRAITDLDPDVTRIVHRVSLRGERPYGPAMPVVAAQSDLAEAV
jgi:alpha-ketoglutarate-dependent taurine dioxygenase